MKKLFTFVLLAVMISVFSVCHAISPEKMKVGGIYIYQSLPEVVSIYGEPVSKKTEQAEAGFRHVQKIYEYGCNGTTFNITFVNDKVYRILVSGNNGIATSDGIKVGASLSEIKRLLGPGTEIRSKDGTRCRLWYAEDGATEDPIRKLNFYLKDNKVESIYVDSGIEI